MCWALRLHGQVSQRLSRKWALTYRGVKEVAKEGVEGAGVQGYRALSHTGGCSSTEPKGRSGRGPGNGLGTVTLGETLPENSSWGTGT